LKSVFCHLFSVFLFVSMMSTTSHAFSLERLQKGLPEQIMTWSKDAADEFYTPLTIFDYINGGAEVYKAYNMRRCLTRRYITSGGPAIVLDAFDMGTSEDAYGVFTHDPAGDAIQLGQDGRWRPGWLNFWKDRYYISIYSEEDTPAAKEAVRWLGEKVDALIQKRGVRPKIIGRLPAAGLVAASIRYFHHHVILNYHYYLSDENLLNLSPDTEAVLAEYQREKEKALILLISYSRANVAVSAYTDFNRHYLEQADQTGAVRLENNSWSASKINGRLLVIVLEADNRPLAETLLETVD